MRCVVRAAGVSVGAVAEEGGGAWRSWELLADAGGLEEGLGALVLHAAGTRAGLTALQLAAVAPGAHSPVKEPSPVPVASLEH